MRRARIVLRSASFAALFGIGLAVALLLALHTPPTGKVRPRVRPHGVCIRACRSTDREALEHQLELAQQNDAARPILERALKGER